MDDNVVEEGRATYSPVVTVSRSDETVWIKLENKMESDESHAEFDFTEFNGQESQSPSPEPECNDRRNGSIHCPIPEETEEEEDEVSESEPSELGSVIATPACMPR